MRTTPAQAVERLRELDAAGELEPLCERLGVEALVVFGSAIDRDRPLDADDLDVAVRLGDPGGLLEVVNSLVDATGCDRVDVLDLDRAGPVAVEQALVGTLWLYEAEDGALAALRDRAMVLRMDTEWLRRLDLELMAEQ